MIQPGMYQPEIFWGMEDGLKQISGEQLDLANA